MVSPIQNILSKNLETICGVILAKPISRWSWIHWWWFDRFTDHKVHLSTSLQWLCSSCMTFVCLVFFSPTDWNNFYCKTLNHCTLFFLKTWATFTHNLKMIETAVFLLFFSPIYFVGAPVFLPQHWKLLGPERLMPLKLLGMNRNPCNFNPSNINPFIPYFLRDQPGPLTHTSQLTDRLHFSQGRPPKRSATDVTLPFPVEREVTRPEVPFPGRGNSLADPGHSRTSVALALLAVARFKHAPEGMHAREGDEAADLRAGQAVEHDGLAGGGRRNQDGHEQQGGGRQQRQHLSPFHTGVTGGAGVC